MGLRNSLNDSDQKETLEAIDSFRNVFGRDIAVYTKRLVTPKGIDEETIKADHEEREGDGGLGGDEAIEREAKEALERKAKDEAKERRAKEEAMKKEKPTEEDMFELS